MGLHITHEVYPQLSLDATNNLKLFWPERGQQTVTYDMMQSATPGTIALAAATTVTLSRGEITSICGLYIQVNSACQISLDDGTSWINITPAPQAGIAKFFLEGLIPSVQLQSDALIPLNGVYVLWGDPPSS